MSTSDEERGDGSSLLASKRKSQKLLGQRTNSKVQQLLGADLPYHLPDGVRNLFIGVSVVQGVLALPAFVSPSATLQLVGANSGNTLSSRLAAAAVLGLGVGKYMLADNGFAAVESLTTVESIVSSLAAAGVAFSLLENPSSRTASVIGLLGGFLALDLVSLYISQRLKDVARESN